MFWQRLTRAWFGILLVPLVITTVPACDVPVFRYALERWRSDVYQLVVLHRGPLATADQARVEALREESVDGSGHCNLDVISADIANDKSVAPRDLWKLQNQKDAALPWAVLLAPAQRDTPATVWAGPLAEADPARLLDSPARRELVKRLAAGESVVWILLTSGKAKADAQAAKLIGEKTKLLEQELRLPAGIGQPGSEVFSEIPLRIKFSTLQIARDDPAERVLIDMLMAGQPSLAEEMGPLAFASFGRARILGGIGGEDMSEDVIIEASSMLCGPCSCQMKEMNPGYDLLTRANWDDLITGELTGPHEMPPLKGFSEFADAAARGSATGTIATGGAPANPHEAAASNGGALIRSVVIIVALAFCVLGAASLYMIRGRNPRMPR
ncbi:MAG TPA: hypothetical protein PLU30_08405 [Verrucomicrobiae bacterium]|nr:hypothetical protein [Verrucomicrobiae bacterium]